MTDTDQINDCTQNSLHLTRIRGQPDILT